MPVLIRGKNDLLTVNKELSLEWNCDKNVELTPADITAGSQKKSGGFVKIITNGRLLHITETMELDVLIAQGGYQ